MIKKWLAAEQFPSKVGTEFDNAASANAAILAINRTPGLETASVELVAPGDPDLARKLEPESQGIVRTIIRTHIAMGSIGVGLGLLLAFGLMAADVRMVSTNPTTAIVTIAAFGLVFGLMFGGFLALRPDHVPILNMARESSLAGKWFVVVHARNSSQRDEAGRVLEGVGSVDDPVLQTV